MRNQSRQQLKFQALLAERAHFMRHNATDTEAILWRQLAGSALGVAFRTRDARRDRVLQRLGYRVLRIDAELVRRNTAEPVALIMAALRSAP